MKKYFTILTVLIFLSVGMCLAFIGKVAQMNATAPSHWNIIAYSSTYGNGQSFHYLEYLPDGYVDDHKDYPVIISLTGLGWNTDTTSTGFLPNLLKGANLERTIRDGRDYPFIIITPHQPTKVKGRYDYTGFFPDGIPIRDDSLEWDVNIIDEILERAKKDLRIDENRIYLMGCSMGGGGVWKYLQAHGDKIAAAVPISGYYTTYGPYTNNPHVDVDAMTKKPVDFACNEKIKHTPIWAFHSGDDDFIRPIFTYKAVNAINNCKPAPSPKVKLTVFKEGGHLKIYPRVFEYDAKWDYTITRNPKVTGGAEITEYLPSKPFQNDVFAWLLSHSLKEQSINHPPTDIALSHINVTENKAIGTLVGEFSTTDPDEADVHTYSLVDGEGAEDNPSFSIQGDQLLTNAVFDYENKPGLKIRVQTDDGKGGLFAKVFNIQVKDTVEDNPPTDIALDHDSIAENMDTGSVVGNLSTTDPDKNDAHTYSLVDGEGAEDNASFSIKDEQLVSAEVFDFEQKTTYSVRIQTNDGKGGTFAKPFVIYVKDVEENGNHAPTDIVLSDHIIKENEPENTVIGTFSTTDEDEGDTHTYSLVEGVEDNAMFSIQNSQLLSQTVFEYEQKSVYFIRVQTNDGRGGTFSKDFTINIEDVQLEENNPPTDIALSATSVDENVPEGTVVGSLSTTDPDENDVHTYSLVSGQGDSDNAAFSVEKDTLKTAAVFDFEKKTSYQIRIQTDDGNGGIFEKVFVIDVNDLDDNNAPVVANTIAAQNTQVGEKFSFSIPDNIFSDADAGDQLTYTANLSDGRALPSWLTFDADSRTLSGTPTPADTGTFDIQVVATDLQGAKASTDFDLMVEMVTAIGDNLEKQLKVYPVPSQDGKVVVDFGIIPEESVQILILTLTGQVLKSEYLSNLKKATIDVSDISAGTYIIEIKSKNFRYRDKLLLE